MDFKEFDVKEKRFLPAQFLDRLHALSVDYIVIFIAALVVIFMQFNPIYKYLIVLLTWYVFNILPYFFKFAVTLGKYKSDLIILDDLSKPVSLKTIHLRESFKFFMFLITLGGYFIISYFLTEKRLDKRSPHDLLFKTRVVYKYPKLD